jgi:hypothetical protein
LSWLHALYACRRRPGSCDSDRGGPHLSTHHFQCPRITPLQEQVVRTHPSPELFRLPLPALALHSCYPATYLPYPATLASTHCCPCPPSWKWPVHIMVQHLPSLGSLIIKHDICTSRRTSISRAIRGKLDRKPAGVSFCRLRLHT